MFINKFAPIDRGRSTVITFGQYQNRSSVKSNVDPPRQATQYEIGLSNENKNLADYFTKLSLIHFKNETDDKVLKKDLKQINIGLNYFI